MFRRNGKQSVKLVLMERAGLWGEGFVDGHCSQGRGIYSCANGFVVKLATLVLLYTAYTYYCHHFPLTPVASIGPTQVKFPKKKYVMQARVESLTFKSEYQSAKTGSSPN